MGINNAITDAIAIRKQYSGVLHLLGNATVFDGKHRCYSVIEIGEHTIKKVVCSQFLANYLDPGEEIELLLIRPSMPRIVVAGISAFVLGCWLAIKLQSVIPFLVGIFVASYMFFTGKGLSSYGGNWGIEKVKVNGKTYDNSD